ncbi:hypothetical protein J6590_044031 [Homalodisca vitripennis]|nr:hypothetical protein J6590_044031 [Homalodisca vitripennis]
MLYGYPRGGSHTLTHAQPRTVTNSPAIALHWELLRPQSPLLSTAKAAWHYQLISKWGCCCSWCLASRRQRLQQCRSLGLAVSMSAENPGGHAGRDNERLHYDRGRLKINMSVGCCQP